MKISEVITERLLLRRWRDADREPFFQMCQDADAMCYLLPITDRAASDAFIERLESHFDSNGFGMCAAERRDTGEFIGIIGLQIPRIAITPEPCIEAGWRLCRSAWGQGFAREGASAIMDAGFMNLDVKEIVAVTAIHNERSWRVMERLGMQRDTSTFAHPALAADHPLSEHFMYRMQRG
jgi:RimJ/RimL family protein N-acetyltransferase